MKVFFTDNCYWDDSEESIFRDGQKVKITPSQRKLVAKLIKCNGRMVPHRELYHAMTNVDACGEYKTALSNQFSRNKSNEKGLLIRVPEINNYFEMSKSLDGGGYMIKVPPENCIETEKDISQKKIDGLNIWYTIEDISLRSKHGNCNESYKVSKLMREYLQGGPCTWPIMFSPDGNCPVRRDIMDGLLELIEYESGVIVLTGAGGEGKTTILMQLCVELYKTNKNFLFHSSTYKYDLPIGFWGDVIIVDNPSNTREFKIFLSNAISWGQTVVIAVRSNEWNILKDNLYDDVKRSIKEIEIPKISLGEAKKFAVCVKRNLSSIKRSEEELKNLFYRDSYGFLYASMLMAVYNCESLEEITYQMIEKIGQYEKSSPCLKVLAAIVFAEKSNMTINSKRYKMLCQKLDIDERDPKYYLKKEISVNGSLYQTRHKSISNLFYKYLYIEGEGEWKNYLCDEEIEIILCALVDCYLNEIEKINKDLNPKDIRVISVSNFLREILDYTQDDECVDYILQRMIESCQKHGHAIVDRTFHVVRDIDVKINIGRLCYERQLPVWEVYSHWISEFLETGENMDEVRKYLKNICMMSDAPKSLWILWGQVEEEMGNIGTCEIENSATWIFNKACTCNQQDGTLWIAYTKFIKKHFKDRNENSKLSIGKILETACLNYGCREQIWSEWANYEEENGNVGDYGIVGSAAWIHKEACEKSLNNCDGWIKWARFAKKNKDTCGEISANAILERACLHMNAGTDVWNEWVKEEISLGNIGNYDLVGSAAWVVKEACMNRNQTCAPDLWERWILFVNDYPEVENNPLPVEILRVACMEKRIKNLQSWIHWAKEEINVGNVGGYDTVGSAAWIFKECAEKLFPMDCQSWMEWAKFAEKNICHDESKEYTPANILKTGCLEYSVIAPAWVAWAKFVEKMGEVGNYETPLTAAWIIKEGCTNHNVVKDTDSVLEWAEFAYRNPMYDGDGEYINAEYILQMASKRYSGFRNQSWDDLRNFKKKIGYIEE